MNNNKIQLRGGIVIAIIAFAALSRLIPHPWNFTPIAAIGLFGAAYFSKKSWALIIPFAALFISDLLVNNIYYPIFFPEFYKGFTFMSAGWYWYYGAFALIIGLGFLTLNKVKPLSLIGTGLGASIIFFLVTNFGAWLASPTLYSTTPSGLLACYTAGIPFFWNTLAGDLFYIGVMFGSFEFLKNRYPNLAFTK